MTYWIYNMGLPVPARNDQLKVKTGIKAISSSARAAKIEDTEGNITQQPVSHVDHLNSDRFTLNKGYQEKTDNHRQMVIYAQDIMSKTLVTLPENMLFSQAWQQFQQHRFRHFPVVNKNNQILGIISDRDMFHSPDFKQQNNGLHHPDYAISKIMTNKVLVASLKTNIRDISRTMFNQHIGAIPIVDDKGKLSGLITRSDILRTIIKNEPMEFWV